MTPTPTSTPVLSADEMYDLIMGQIEPELKTDTLPFLDYLYEGETEEEHKARAEWYAIAFEVFEKQYRHFVDGWKNYYVDLRKKAEGLKRRTVESNDKDDDIESVEQSLQNL